MSAINKINVDNVSYNIEDSRVDNIADSIPTASTEQKGLVQVGQGINVDENGVISVEGGSGGDSVSYTDVGNVTNPVTIGMININGTDYNINAPAAYYNNYVSGQTTVVGQIYSGSVLGSQEIFVPAVMYEDQIQGSHVLGQLVVGGDSYPITYTPAASGDSVQFNSLLASGTQIGTITINGVDTAIYAPAGGSGGGSSVSYRDNTSPEDQHRTVIGELTIDGGGYYIYVPSTISVDWDNVLNKPTIPTATSELTNDSDFITAGDARDIAADQISNTSIYDLQGTPAIIGDVSGLTVTPDLSSGTKIATISWADNEHGDRTAELYAPAGGSGSTDWSDITNKPTIVNSLGVYPNQWNNQTETGHITWTDDFGEHTLTSYIPTVSYTDNTTPGAARSVGTLRVGDNTYNINVPNNGGGSSSVDWSDVQNKPAIQPGSKGMNSICQGGNNATGDFSIAIGYDTKATNHCAVAVGGSTRSSGMWSVATGDGTIAAGDRQIAAGTYNAEDANNYFAFMVGNGDYNGGSTIRKNAEATAWNGNKYIEGNLYVNCNSWTTRPSSDTVSGKPELVTTNAGGVRVATLTDLAGIGGDTVTVTQTLTSGTKIAEIDVGGTSTDIYAPAGSATDWADITNKPDITPVAGRDGINNIAGLGGSVNQAQGVNPKGTIVIGDSARSSADNAVALGAGATVTGLNGTAIGWGAQAGRDSIALGSGSQASSYGAALGWGVTARSQYQTAIGVNNITDANGQYGLIVGNGITSDGTQLPPSDAMAIGFDGTQYLAGNVYVNCTDFTTTANGLQTTNCGGTKVATLSDIKADWAITDASASGYIANKPSIMAGTGNYAIQVNGGVAQGEYSFAENGGTAQGTYSHAEGRSSTGNTAECAHAEGNSCYAGKSYSHAEGYYTQIGSNSYGFGGHAEGFRTYVASQAQHAQGRSNIIDKNGIFADIIGNGSWDGNTRANAEATDWNGNKYLSGGIYVGCTDYTTTFNGLTTLGAGGFRIDMAPAEKETEVEDPTEPESMTSGDFVMIDTIIKTMGSEEQEDPDDGTIIQVPTTVETTHNRSWIRLPKEYSIRDLAGDVGSLQNMNPPDDSFNDGGIYTLQIWSVKSYEDDGEGNMIAVYTPEYRWVKTAETTPEDAEEPTE